MKQCYYTSKIFWKVFLSYFLMLLLILLMLGGLFVNDRRRRFSAEQALRIEEATGNMNLELNQRFFALSEFAQNMSRIPWVHKYYSGYQVFDDYFDAVRKLEISKELSLYFGNMEIVRSACILFPQRGMTVSTANGWMDADLWFKSMSIREEWELFEQKLAELDGMDYFGLTGRQNEGSIMVWAVPLGDARPAQAYLLYQVDMTVLRGLIQKQMPDYMESLWIIGREGEELLRAENGAASFLGGRSVTEYEMPALGLTYRYAYMENAILLSGEEYIQIFWMIAGTFLLGLGLAFLLAYVTYRPLGKISRRLWGGKQRDDRFLSDYRLIEHSLDELEQDNQEMSEQVASYVEMKRADMLHRLLQGFFDEKALEENLAFYHIPFEERMCYQVVLVSGGAADERLAPYQAANLSLSLMKSVAQLRECRAELVDGIDDIFVVILAFSEPDAASVLDAEFAQRLAGLARPYFKSHPIVSIGGLQTGFLGISISYHFAMEQKEHMLHKLKMLPCGENAWQRDFLYPETWEAQLLKGLKLGDMASVSCIMKEIYHKNRALWQEGEGPWRRTRELGLVSALLETLLRAVSELSLSDRDFMEYVDVLLVGDSFDDKWKVLLHFCENICGRAGGVAEPEKPDTGAQLLAYVDAHFQESGLCLKELATRFGMTVQSVSRLFKARTGETFYNYLYRKRMEYACELLKYSADTVSDISGKVGYDNDFSFKRAFIRYAGIRPKEYREQGGR